MIETLDELGLLQLGLERERIQDHWLETLVSAESRDDTRLSWMIGRSGRPGWMGPEGPDARQDLLERLDTIVANAARMQSGAIHRLFAFIPDRSSETFTNGPWWYRGASRHGDTLELWFAAEGMHVSAFGSHHVEYDIAVVRCPLTHPDLKAVLEDRSS